MNSFYQQYGFLLFFGILFGMIIVAGISAILMNTFNISLVKYVPTGILSINYGIEKLFLWLTLLPTFYWKISFLVMTIYLPNQIFNLTITIPVIGYTIPLNKHLFTLNYGLSIIMVLYYVFWRPYKDEE